MTRDLVLGLEVVLADGRIWNGLKLLRKDNRGYDLKQLFIGSEGTLGVITAVALKLFPKPAQVETALVALGSVSDAVAFYAHVRAACSDLATAFELLTRPVDRGVRFRSIPASSILLPRLIPPMCSWNCHRCAGIDLRALLEMALISAGDLVRDAVLAASQEQVLRLWRLRETTVEKQGRGEPLLPFGCFLADLADSGLRRGGGTRLACRLSRVWRECLWPYRRRQSPHQPHSTARPCGRRTEDPVSGHGAGVVRRIG